MSIHVHFSKSTAFMVHTALSSSLCHVHTVLTRNRKHRQSVLKPLQHDTRKTRLHNNHLSRLVSKLTCNSQITNSILQEISRGSWRSGMTNGKAFLAEWVSLSTYQVHCESFSHFPKGCTQGPREASGIGGTARFTPCFFFAIPGAHRMGPSSTGLCTSVGQWEWLHLGLVQVNILVPIILSLLISQALICPRLWLEINKLNPKMLLMTITDGRRLISILKKSRKISPVHRVKMTSNHHT